MQVSIVVCTDGRAAALSNALRCLQFLDGPDFEVCVVRGPTEDGIAEVLAPWAGAIKVARNPERNLSISRNLGIAMAAGDIVAFMDDDGLPEPEWLRDLSGAFADPRVAGAGGIVMDHTGAREQYRFATCDRLGNVNLKYDEPASAFGFPLSFNFPYLQGTNCAFRHDDLVAIGGFDEEYDFYLDETDVCCRLVDRGRLIRQLATAAVHHKFLPSAIRNARRVTYALYPILKNKLYFSLVNNHGHYGLCAALDDMQAFCSAKEHELRDHIAGGRANWRDMDQFVVDVERAWAVGLERGQSRQRRLKDPQSLSDPSSPFLPFPRLVPDGGPRTFVFLSQEYPPQPTGGVGRYIHQLACAVAMLGHHVHVLTRGEGHDRIDFEDDVWVHRISERQSVTLGDLTVPAHIWRYSSTMLDELRRIRAGHGVECAYAPIWDCEGIALLMDGKIPLVTGLQTPLHFWLASHPHVADSERFLADFAKPMLTLETQLLRQSDGIHAISDAIARDIADAYGVSFESERIAFVPLGIDDWLELPAQAPAELPSGSLRLLFVGRLETRKGIDLLLDIAPKLLRRYPFLHIDIVGDDALPGPGGTPYRAAFESSVPEEERRRARFHGTLAEQEIRGFYQACDIFVAPSRFESFGLVLVEAMMYAKPVVGCRTGGMVEVVEEGTTALLAEPDDPISLMACLDRLIADPGLRALLGQAGRERYERCFRPQAMAEGVVALMRRARQLRNRC